MFPDPSTSLCFALVALAFVGFLQEDTHLGRNESPGEDVVLGDDDNKGDAA